jgi:hypothetical protein
MTSDELYAIDPDYRKWRDEEDRTRARFFDHTYTLGALLNDALDQALLEIDMGTK